MGTLSWDVKATRAVNRAHAIARVFKAPTVPHGSYPRRGVQGIPSVPNGGDSGQLTDAQHDLSVIGNVLARFDAASAVWDISTPEEKVDMASACVEAVLALSRRDK